MLSSSYLVVTFRGSTDEDLDGSIFFVKKVPTIFEIVFIHVINVIGTQHPFTTQRLPLP